MRTNALRGQAHTIQTAPRTRPSHMPTDSHHANKHAYIRRAWRDNTEKHTRMHARTHSWMFTFLHPHLRTHFDVRSHTYIHVHPCLQKHGKALKQTMREKVRQVRVQEGIGTHSNALAHTYIHGCVRLRHTHVRTCSCTPTHNLIRSQRMAANKRG